MGYLQLTLHPGSVWGTSHARTTSSATAATIDGPAGLSQVSEPPRPRTTAATPATTVPTAMCSGVCAKRRAAAAGIIIKAAHKQDADNLDRHCHHQGGQQHHRQVDAIRRHTVRPRQVFID